MMVKEEDEDRIVLADSVVKNIFYGLFGIAAGLFMLLGWIAHADFSDIGLLEMYVGLFAVSVFGGIFIGGFVRLLVRESIIIDKRLQSVTILEESPIMYFESIKKIPFVGLWDIIIQPTVTSLRNTSLQIRPRVAIECSDQYT